MTPLQIIQLVELVSGLLQTLLPVVAEAVKGGTISAESQLAVRQKLDALRAKLDSGDLGDHWKID